MKKQKFNNKKAVNVKVAAAVVCAGSLALSACTIEKPNSKSTATVTATAENKEAAQMSPTISDEPALPSNPEGSAGGDASVTGDADQALSQAVDAVIQQYRGRAQLAVSTGAQTRSFGYMNPYPAWSTIKVPIAIAAYNNAVEQDGGDANGSATTAIKDKIQAAVEWSDNNAAEALWESLGDGTTAGKKTEQVLQNGGNSGVQVQINPTRQYYSGFGQTQWPVDQAASFGANLPCIAGSQVVVEDMSQVVADQSYGLGTIQGAHFKGGWGPDESNSYLVRQFGYFTTSHGRVAVAIAAQAGDGTYQTGQAMLTDMAKAISSHADSLKTTTCTA